MKNKCPLAKQAASFAQRVQLENQGDSCGTNQGARDREKSPLGNVSKTTETNCPDKIPCSSQILGDPWRNKTQDKFPCPIHHLLKQLTPRWWWQWGWGILTVQLTAALTAESPVCYQRRRTQGDNFLCGI